MEDAKPDGGVAATSAVPERVAPPPTLVLDAAVAFQRSATVMTAVRLGVFDAIAAGAATADDIADEVGARPRPMRLMLESLAASGFLSRVDARESGDGVATYALTAESEEYLVRKEPRYLGHYLGWFLDAFPAFSHLDEVILTGRSASRYAVQNLHPDDDPVEAYTQAMVNVARPSARAVLGAIGIENHRRVLDLGGGPGVWCAEAVRRNPGIEAVVMEHPSVFPATTRYLRGLDILGEGAGQVAVREGDFFTDPVGTDFDLVILSRILETHAPDQCSRILEIAHGALAPGGRIIVHGLMAGEDAPPTVAELGLFCHVVFDRGEAYPPTTIRDWLERAGFEVERMERLPAPLVDAVVVARRVR